jgi:tetratricopeptide (TPR) repeat protein
MGAKRPPAGPAPLWGQNQEQVAEARQFKTDGVARRDMLVEALDHHRAGNLDQAKALYVEALVIEPNDVDTLYPLSVLYQQQGDGLKAVGLIERALAIEPNHIEARYSLGLALRGVGRLTEAEASYREVLRLQPDHAKAHCKLGLILRELRRPTDAEASYREALRLDADYPEVCNNLGNALCDLGRLGEAEASYREALRLQPDSLETLNNLAGALSDLGRTAEALAYYERALEIRPDDATAHFGRSVILLLRGEYAEGWREYEWRWRGATTMQAKLQDFTEPQWQGEDVAGQTVFLHAEQGFGDTLQFCRYASLIGTTARVVLEVQPQLLRICSSLAGVAQVLPRGERRPAFDVQCPLMNLPLATGTTLETIPFGKAAYLFADPQLVADWRKRLAHLNGLRVGLVWAGALLPDAESTAVDGRRSMALAAMAPLGQVRGVCFVSLQVGEPADQTADAALGLVLHDFTGELRDFADTAALVEVLDLVISVDTSVAHLAGALGKPIWLLNRFDTCWRWLADRDDSPWYPQLRQFRQARPGDWSNVMLAVRDALQQLAVNHPHRVC